MTRRNETFMHQAFVAKHECKHLEKQDVSLSLQVMTLMSMFANSALLGGGVRVRVWIREQRKIKRRSKALLCL